MDKILSIIIPSYNMEAYLAKGLDSVLLIYNPSPLVVFVVNVGSKDGTLEIARSYATRFPGIVNVIDKENGHYGSCINAGLKIAQGKYVRILDADDSFYTDEFEEFVKFLKTTDADLIVNDYKKEYINGNAVEYTYDLPRNKIVSFCDYVASDNIRNTAAGGDLSSRIDKRHWLSATRRNALHGYPMGIHAYPECPHIGLF